MRLTHCLEITPPGSTILQPLTREQLWHGLVERAENPLSFVLGLDSYSVIERRPDGLLRELCFGDLRVHDRVTYDAPHSVRYDTEPTLDTPAASLIMSIEDMDDGSLCVRFQYDSGEAAPAGSLEAMYDEFRRNAYEQADVDTMARIRQLASEGRL